MLWYPSKFKNLNSWCLGTAISQFVIFLFLFLGVSYLSTLIETEDEKYIVMALSLYMIVPFTFSNLCLFGLFHKNYRILRLFIHGSIFNIIVISIVMFGSGIYLAIEGTAYIAYSLIGFGIILDLFLVHGLLLTYGRIHEDFKENDNDNEDSVI